MDKPARIKSKNRKQPTRPKSSKKKKTEGPTCSMFLAEIARKLAARRREEESSPTSIVHTIIDSITNALPVIFTRRSPDKKDSPVQIENLQNLAPELVANDLIEIPIAKPNEDEKNEEDTEETVVEVATAESVTRLPAFKIPKMPLVGSEVLKVAAEKKKKAMMRDASVNTNNDHDMATELAKHVATLKRISLIAEEFNQKTARNLKEIVDSVQGDLIKKLEEVRHEHMMQEKALQIREIEEELSNEKQEKE